MALFQEFAGISGIYRILNARNGKFYIGSTDNAQRRFRGHRNGLINNKHHSSKLQRAYNKEQDKSLFVFQMMVFSEKNVLESLETRFIEQMNPAYNMKKAANGRFIPWSKGKKFTENHKQKLRLAKKKNPTFNRAKFTTDQVIEILNSTETFLALAKKYLVSLDCIKRIYKNKTYTHVARHKILSKKEFKIRCGGWTEEKRTSQGDIARGEKARDAKLSQNQVLEIISSTKKNMNLAKEYGVDPSTICNIRKGRTWKHLLRNSPSA
jgi:group I intron endonuclease